MSLTIHRPTTGWGWRHAGGTDELAALPAWHRAPGVGDLIALPILSTPTGESIDLLAAANDRPTVLLILRGGRCPSSAATLRAFGQARPAIAAAGGVVIAVLADQPPWSTPMAEGSGVTLAIDARRSFARSLDLVDETADDHRHGTAQPIPAAYVLASCGRVTFAHVGADLAAHDSPPAALAALHRLAAHEAASGIQTFGGY